MDTQSTNGPAEAILAEEPTLEQRGAALSSAIVSQRTPAPAVTPHVTAEQLARRLAVIEEAMRTTMKDGVDYGRVPGTDKPALFKPGAEKLSVLFQLDVQPRNELVWGPGEHLTVISRATVHHAPTGTRLGYGEGICSSRESKYAYRSAGVNCPECGKETVRKSRPRPDGTGGKGWYCWAKPEKGSDGCGAQFPDDDDPRLVGQKVGRIENPELPDTWNTVDKMAKKRAYVDAVLSVTSASAIFTQDIAADPSEASAEAGPSYGPVVAGDIKASAQNAAISLRDGDLEQAETLWNEIQAALDGYMPHAAALALMHAAERPNYTPKPAAGGAPSANNAQTPNDEPQTQLAGAEREARQSLNPHGSRVRTLANAHGVESAELANLIRVAAGTNRIAAEQAAGQLPALLERITEPIATQTLELIETLHPAAGRNAPGDGATVIGVNFDRFEPPSAA